MIPPFRWALLLASLHAPIALAQSDAIESTSTAGDASITLSLAPPHPEVSEPISLTVSVTTAGGTLSPDAFASAIGETLGDFHVESLGGVESRGSSLVGRYRLITFASGKVTLPPIVFEVRDANGVAQRLASKEVVVEVASLIGDDADPKHFRDIKGALDLAPVAPQWPLVLAIAGGACIIAGLGTWAFLAARRRRPPELAIDAAALREFERLEADDLPRQRREQEFHVRLTDIVRSFIERRFSIRAPELTTQEFLGEAKRSPSILPEQQAMIAAILTSADMVKFAGVRPDPGICAQSLDQARRFVRACGVAGHSTTASTSVPAPPDLPVPPVPEAPR